MVTAKKESREVIYSIGGKKVKDMLELREELLILTVEDMMECVCK